MYTHPAPSHYSAASCSVHPYALHPATAPPASHPTHADATWPQHHPAASHPAPHTHSVPTAAAPNVPQRAPLRTPSRHRVHQRLIRRTHTHQVTPHSQPASYSAHPYAPRTGPWPLLVTFCACIRLMVRHTALWCPTTRTHTLYAPQCRSSASHFAHASVAARVTQLPFSVPGSVHARSARRHTAPSSVPCSVRARPAPRRPAPAYGKSPPGAKAQRG